MATQWEFKGFGGTFLKPWGLRWTSETNHFALEVKKVGLQYHWFAVNERGQVCSSQTAHSEGYASPVAAQTAVEQWANCRRG
jgi:hypothetical protein